MRTFNVLLFFVGLLPVSAQEINDSLLTIIQHIDSVRSVYYDNAVTEDIADRLGWDSNEIKELYRNKQLIDSLQLPIIINIIDTHGYPGRSLVGKKYEHVALLVLRNSELDVLRKYQPIIQEAANNDEIEWKIVARLIDRIRIQEGREQVYGTHLHRNAETNIWEIYAIENAACVDQRRAKIGLEPMEEYVRPFGIKYEKAVECRE